MVEKFQAFIVDQDDKGNVSHDFKKISKEDLPEEKFKDDNVCNDCREKIKRIEIRRRFKWVAYTQTERLNVLGAEFLQ